ncbi:hypothetical protein NUU61_005040 [Penicillium alfredii]|uniref:DUF7492 domain-containing protein n=1 Tax=Penicillium alfredii TaxID=1506179 RepID=A0A9W9K784_9EURO|nr:uncharacterized protein NUU61_005040 [Penicillium alfredii]KAJ5095684.1 hypothetical protein NUU61_005040 [Penicillium alfredii]
MILHGILRVLLALFIASADAHSWVEELTVIAPNGTFIGAPGYARGNHRRTDSGFSDTTMTYLIPPGSRANVTQILPTDKMCKDTQQKQTQTDGSPRLKASAGAAIALRFQENGHVTLPQNQPGKPPNRGTVYVYGTTKPKTDENLLDIHGVWNRKGTGGDKRGILLSKQNFDDGQCYQINPSNISVHRQEKYPHTANQLMGADLWCQQDIRLPAIAPAGKPYTLYWVWDWPTAPGADPSYPQGKKEIYTTCMDVDVVDTAANRVKVAGGYASDQDINNAAIYAQFAELAQTRSSISSMTSSAPSVSTPMAAIRTTTVTTLKTVVRTVHDGCQPTGK